MVNKISEIKSFGADFLNNEAISFVEAESSGNEFVRRAMFLGVRGGGHLNGKWRGFLSN